jgi:hypothetical protein
MILVCKMHECKYTRASNRVRAQLMIFITRIWPFLYRSYANWPDCVHCYVHRTNYHRPLSSRCLLIYLFNGWNINKNVAYYHRTACQHVVHVKTECLLYAYSLSHYHFVPIGHIWLGMCPKYVRMILGVCMIDGYACML